MFAQASDSSGRIPYDSDSATHRYGFFHIVRYHDSGDPMFIPKSKEELSAFLGCEHIESCKCFVKQEQLRALEKDSCQCHTLTLPSA